MPQPTSALALGACLVLATSGPAATATDPGFDSWCSRMAAAGPAAEDSARDDDPPAWLALRNAQYDVDVLGSVAVGALTLEFQNTASEPRIVQFLDRVPAGVQLESIRLQLADASEADWIELPLPTRPGEAAGKRPERVVRIEPRAPTPAPTPVAIVPAGERVTIHERFRMPVPFQSDRFRLRLPAVGGDCGALLGAAAWEDGPTGPLGARVRIHAERELDRVESPTHPVYVTFDGTHSLVELAADPVGDRPIEIGFALGLSDAPSLAAFVAPAVDGEREVVVVLSPALETAAETVRPKELLFLLDTSGSMHGEKIAKATHALGTCLERTAPADRFNLARFSHDFELLHAEPVPGTAEAVAAARLWLERQRTGGNTRLSPALEATLEQAHDATLHRLVVIVSDGKLGDAPEVQALLQARLGEARLFLVGIGDDVNEPEILRLAQLGRGTAVFARAAEQLEAAITELFGGIAAPVAWDLRLHWGEAEVVSMEPSHVPDLYAGRPVTIRARVRGELPPDLLVEASTMDGVRVFQTALPAGGAAEFDQLERRAD